MGRAEPGCYSRFVWSDGAEFDRVIAGADAMAFDADSAGTAGGGAAFFWRKPKYANTNPARPITMNTHTDNVFLGLRAPTANSQPCHNMITINFFLVFRPPGSSSLESLDQCMFALVERTAKRLSRANRKRSDRPSSSSKPSSVQLPAQAIPHAGSALSCSKPRRKARSKVLIHNFKPQVPRNVT